MQLKSRNWAFTVKKNKRSKNGKLLAAVVASYRKNTVCCLFLKLTAKYCIVSYNIKL